MCSAVFLTKFNYLDLIGPRLPSSVPWFGYLGVVVSSLQGIFAHNAGWKNSFMSIGTGTA